MKLVLLRHGESEWNKLNLFTGWTDVDLSEKGREEGLAEGVEIGLAEGMETGMARGSLMIQIKTIIKKVQKGLDLPEIAEAMEMDTDSIRPVWQAVKAAAPDYDQEKILEDLMAR